MAMSCRSILTRCLQRGFSTVSTVRVPAKGENVIVGMSGGVDSSVTAMLLAQKDYNLSAVFMRNWDFRDESGTDRGCEWEKDWEDVQRVCRQLDIPCRMIDLTKEYWNRVFEPCLQHWEQGATPNPDIWCNKEIKFGALLERLPALHPTPEKFWFATGHYARISHLNHPSSPSPNPRPALLRAVDPTKDQSYYLSSISEPALARTLFPIGSLTKAEVRELARKHQLPTAERPESMGICFIGEKGKFSDFLSKYILPQPGPIIDESTGKAIGQHTGLWNYTIGQRAGVGGTKMKVFVSRKDTITNTMYVVPGSDHPSLWCSSIRATGWNWIWSDWKPPNMTNNKGFRATARFRHRMLPVSCGIKQASNGDIIIIFDDPQKAAAPGQMVALYDGDWCLGCGIIKKAQTWKTRTHNPTVIPNEPAIIKP